MFPLLFLVTVFTALSGKAMLRNFKIKHSLSSLVAHYEIRVFNGLLFVLLFVYIIITLIIIYFSFLQIANLCKYYNYAVSVQ